jgi:lactam utilization protein B
MNRSRSRASITCLAEAMGQAGEIIKRRRVNISRRNSSPPVWKALTADAICIHSDSAIALELAIQLRRLIGT